MALSLRYPCRNLLNFKYGFLRVSSVHRANITSKLFLRRSCSRNNFYRYSLANGNRYCGSSTVQRGRVHGVLLASILGFLGLEKEDDNEKEDELILAIKRSVLMIQRGELNKAEQMLHLALRIAQQKQNQDGITYVYDLLANLALEKGDLAKAEKLFVSVMQRLMTSGAKQDDNRIIHASLKLAQMHSDKGKGGDPERAEEGFRFCLEGLQKKVKKGGEGEADQDTILLLALAEEEYARFCLSQNRLKESQKYLEHAVEHLEHGISFGQRGPDEEFRTALLLNDLGSLCSLNGDQESAKHHLCRAVQSGERGVRMRKETKHIQKDGNRMGDEDLVASLNINLGVVYAKMGLLDKAQKHCLDGWKVAKRVKNDEVLMEANSCLDEVKKLISN